jgi:hypothetical protein
MLSVCGPRVKYPGRHTAIFILSAWRISVRITEAEGEGFNQSPRKPKLSDHPIIRVSQRIGSPFFEQIAVASCGMCPDLPKA